MIATKQFIKESTCTSAFERHKMYEKEEIKLCEVFPSDLYTHSKVPSFTFHPSLRARLIFCTSCFPPLAILHY